MVKKIYLMGLKHTGKTVHGRALAGALSVTFRDTDALVQELDSTETGMRRTVRDIFLEDGAERFRQLEAAACALVDGSEEPLVVATGGGICDNEAALESLRGGTKVYLVDAFDALARRVMRGGIPAFLHTSDPAVARARFREIYDRRSAAYERIADLTIDLTGRSLEEARAVVVSTVEEHLGR